MQSHLEKIPCHELRIRVTASSCYFLYCLDISGFLDIISEMIGKHWFQHNQKNWTFCEGLLNGIKLDLIDMIGIIENSLGEMRKEGGLILQ